MKLPSKVVACRNPECRLMQFWRSECRRCHSMLPTPRAYRIAVPEGMTFSEAVEISDWLHDCMRA